jgi:hypothetical protein
LHVAQEHVQPPLDMSAIISAIACGDMLIMFIAPPFGVLVEAIIAIMAHALLDVPSASAVPLARLSIAEPTIPAISMRPANFTLGFMKNVPRVAEDVALMLQRAGCATCSPR